MGVGIKRYLLVAIVAAALVGCGDNGDGDSEPAGEQRQEAEDRQGEPEGEPAKESDDPLARAEAHAREQYPEATDTDDFLAAAVTGCYLGITGEYLGKPKSWSVERVMNLEYPEPELQAILKRARKDCG